MLKGTKKPYGSRKTKTKSVDIIIVGAGIAGLYAAHRLQQKYPNESLLVLERNDTIGGRIKVEKFHGVQLSVGAGIGRNEDILLKQLLTHYSIEYKSGTKEQVYAFQPKYSNHQIKSFIHTLRSKPAKDGVNMFTHCIDTIGIDATDELIKMSGYQDYLNEPAIEYLTKPTDLEELFFSCKTIHFNWKHLLDSLKENLDILNNVTVQEVQPIQIDDFEKSTYFLLKATHRNLKKTHYYSCSRLVLAITSDTIQRLLPTHSIYSQIHPQAFFKILVSFPKTKIALMKRLVPSYTVCNNILRKIIPIDAIKGVYMIYNDNHYAKTLYLETLHKSKLRKIEVYTHYLNEALQTESLQLVDIFEAFWSVGTHYFEPHKNRTKFLQLAQHPQKNLYVVGEMVSQKQGWVEGALESVNTAFPI